VYTREHLLVASDHRYDDGAPKGLKLVVVQLQARSHRGEGIVARFLRQQRKIPTELAKA
jgi:hypothetical protein